MKLASTIQYSYYRRESMLYIQHFKNYLCKFECYNCNDLPISNLAINAADIVEFYAMKINRLQMH
jgi:hypothetical protein